MSGLDILGKGYGHEAISVSFTKLWMASTLFPMPEVLWGERNTAVTTYFGEIVFFTKMETIVNNTDCDKL